MDAVYPLHIPITDNVLDTVFATRRELDKVSTTSRGPRPRPVPPVPGQLDLFDL